MALRSLPSLRVWLQSTSLLAVVAGYTALFAFGLFLADAERSERHQRLVHQIRSGLITGAMSLPLPQGFGVQAALVPGEARNASPTLRLIDGSYWLTSRSTLSSPGASNVLLEVRQNNLIQCVKKTRCNITKKFIGPLVLYAKEHPVMFPPCTRSGG